MRTLTYYIATSIDGFIATPDGQVDFFLMEGEHADEFFQEMKNYDGVLMGGNTYEFGFNYGLVPGEPAYPGLKHWVFSKTLDFDSTGQVERITHNSIETVRELKKQSGGPIWLCGGSRLAGSLLKAGLIDEVKLKVNPFTLGDGIPLFGGEALAHSWRLLTCQPYSNGVVLMHYKSE